jgi:glycosyltransferase involved in cell wall biosynthesis
VNLLSIIHYPVFGGPHNRNLRLVPSLAARSIQVTVLIPDEPGNAAQRLRSAGIDVITMPLHRLRATTHALAHLGFAARFWPEVRAIRRVIRERAVDIVQINGLVNPHGAVAARLEGVPVVWQLVDTRPPLVLRRAMMPPVSWLADSVMFNGTALIAAHPGGAALSDRSFVYYPPVDLNVCFPGCADRQRVRAELGIPLESPVVGTVANINPQKGIDYFVRAAALIKRRLPDAWFLVVGALYDTHAAYARRLRALAEELGIWKSMVFPGFRDDVERIFSAMDVSLITSVPRSEGTTTTAQESMAVGVPVVATDVGAVSEVVEDGVTGYVVPPLDPQAIADAALRLLRDPALREGMGRAGRQRALERFSLETCAQIHLEAYDYALRRRGRPGVLADRESTHATGPLAQAGGASRAG